MPRSDDIDPARERFAAFYRATGERTFRIASRMACGDAGLAHAATRDAYDQVRRTWGDRPSSSQADRTRLVTGLVVRRVLDTAEAAAPEPAGYRNPALELIERLPAGQRAVAVLYLLDDREPAGVAEALGVPEQTVRDHVERLRVLAKPLLDAPGAAAVADGDDDVLRDLVRRAHDTAPAPAFDVRTGLAEVLGRAAPARHWSELDGRDRQVACLAAVRAGDKTAFDALVRDLSPLVWHVARSNGLTRVEAEDTVQTVWLALIRGVDRIEDPRALPAWLITTARREAGHTRRQAERTRYVEMSDSDEPPSPEPLPEDLVLLKDRDRTLWTAFHRLSARCQELLRLTVLGGRAEYRAVAEELDMPVGSIGPTRGRCLKTLHGLYATEAGEAGS